MSQADQSAAGQAVAAWPAQPFDFDSRHTLFSALVEAMRRHGRYTPNRVEDMRPGQYSYGDLLKISLALGRLACKLTAPGEHVGVFMPNMVSTLGLIFGLTAFRRVPCMLNYTAGPEVIQNACETARIRTVLTSREFLAKANLAETAHALKGVRLLYLEDLRPRFKLVDKLWLLGFALWWPRLAVAKGDPESPAVVLFTSGTEGRPKGVVLSHRAILANIAQVRQAFPFTPQDRFLNALPIFHSFGLTAGALLPLMAGCRLLLYTNPLHYKTIAELIKRDQSTVLFGTSAFLNQYARCAAPEDFKSLHYVIAGAEKLAEAVRTLWREKFGIELFEGYGATEMAPVLSVNLPHASRPGSVGRFLPGVEARLLPVPGIASGGDLHVRGPNGMSGYYRYEAPGVLEPPGSAVGAGWHDTGDVVEIDADGYITIVGRLKRFAKVAGEMVCLEMTEAIARAASGEALHAALNVPDVSRGEAIILFTTDSELTREQLAAAAHGLGYPELAVPRQIRVVDSLPMLGSGKVDYLRLRHANSPNQAGLLAGRPE
ncbi:MAG: AMP-binding protein [Hydrogenophilaceae bacterium]|nr:AMP-binding protein [Hydrogenophilaceae bacterium]